ncbi:hypothetical protein HMPREF3203_00435 [Proteus mirabilis]|nr:hypothetical protein HMPREF3203_00435 [Proteus mirabilis]
MAIFLFNAPNHHYLLKNSAPSCCFFRQHPNINSYIHCINRRI